jgi:alpha-aminoadipic semialdehyde synthase
MHSFKEIGLLGTELPVDVSSWNDLARMSLEQKIGQPIPRDHASFLSALSDVVPVAEDQDNLLEALDWLGLSPNSKHGLEMKPTGNLPPIDYFTHVLANKLRYAPNERDLVVLSHEIVSKGEHDAHEEVHTSSLITYGDSEASAMARTVGLPVAFAALRILSGQITMRGVRGPSDERAMWAGVLADLEEAGLKMEEKTTRRGIEGLLASALEGSVRSI